MPALWSPGDLAARFAPYIDELHDVFAMHGLRYGSPEDVRTIATRLESAGGLNDEVASLVRSMVLREGGSIPRTDLLEILAIAIAGPGLDAAGEELQQPVRQLLTFLHAALRRPWNEPAGPQQSEHAEEEMRAQAARELREAAARIEAEPRGASSVSADGHVSPDEQNGQSPRANIIPFGRARAVFSKLAREDAAEPMEDVAEVAALEPAQHNVEHAAQETANRPGTMDAAQAGAAADSLPEPSLSRTGAAPRHMGPISAAGLLPEFDDEPPLPAAPRLPRGSMAYGLAAAVLAFAVLGVAVHAGPGTRRIVAASQGAPAHAQPLPVAIAAPQTFQAASVASGKPNPEIASGSSRSHFDDDYVAPPYSSIPVEQVSTTETANTMSSSAVSGTQSRAMSKVSVPSNSVAGDVGLRSAAPEEPPAHPRVSAAVMALNLITAPRPDYPLLAKLAHVDGPVVIHAEIGRSGSVVDTEVISGHHLLRHAAENAVRHWRYHPYQVDGKAVPVSTTITVRFRH